MSGPTFTQEQLESIAPIESASVSAAGLLVCQLAAFAIVLLKEQRETDEAILWMHEKYPTKALRDNTWSRAVRRSLAREGAK